MTMATVLPEETVRAFGAGLRGELLRPGDEGYDPARRVWNAMIDRRPALIVRCAGVADVRRAVDFAHEHRLLVAVRGGGHNVAGSAVCDGGLVVDLSRLKGMRVDPARRTARAEAGLTWAEFDRETQAFDLAVTGGAISSTGIAGLTLGGGQGWLMRKHGLTSDNLLSVDLVTADGELLTASADEHADLFWGLRGGGGNFGVATSFEYRLQPESVLLAGMLLHPLERAGDLLRHWREITADAPDELTSAAALLTSPEGAPLAAVLVFYAGALDEGERMVRPLRDFGPPLADLVGPMPYVQVQTLLDASFPAGVRNYWKSNYLTGLTDEAIDALAARFAEVPSPLSSVLLEHVGGAMGRQAQDATAFPHRGARYNFLVISRWVEPTEDQANVGWARAVAAEMQPLFSGIYVNYMGAEDDEQVRAAYGASYARLATLKAKYDPTNFFSQNQNVRPTT
jgi:FAD/FMN-containing dehydrogenase